MVKAGNLITKKVRFFHGIASAMIGPVAMAYVGDITPPGEEGLYQGRLSVAFYLGLGSGPLIGGAVYSIAGLDLVFILMSAMAVVPCILCFFYLPESVPKGRREIPCIWRSFFHPRMQAVLFYRFASCFPYAAFMVFLPVLAATDYHYSTTITGLIIAVEVISMGLSQGYFGKLADSYKKSWLIVAGTLMLSLATLAMPFVRNMWVVFAIAFLIGIGNAMAISAATAVVAIDGRELGQGVVMGAFNTVVSLGITIPPLLFGVVLVAAGVDVVFIISALISLAAIIPFWLLVIRSRRWIISVRA